MLLEPQELLDLLIRKRHILDFPVNFVDTELAKDSIIKKLPDIIYVMRELIDKNETKLPS